MIIIMIIINYMNEGQNKYKYLDTPVLLRPWNYKL